MTWEVPRPQTSIVPGTPEAASVEAVRNAVSGTPRLETLAEQITTARPRAPLDVENAMTGQMLGVVPHCTAGR